MPVYTLRFNILQEIQIFYWSVEVTGAVRIVIYFRSDEKIRSSLKWEYIVTFIMNEWISLLSLNLARLNI